MGGGVPRPRAAGVAVSARCLPLGLVVFVSEEFLRRRFPGWRRPDRWHRGVVVHGWEPGDMIALVDVNVMVCDLKSEDVFAGTRIEL